MRRKAAHLPFTMTSFARLPNSNRLKADGQAESNNKIQVYSDTAYPYLLNRLHTIIRRQPRARALPVNPVVDEVRNSRDNLINGPDSLVHRIALAQGHRALLHGREVERDAVGRAELVVARVALADGRIRVVHAGEDARFAELGGWEKDQGKQGARR